MQKALTVSSLIDAKTVNLQTNTGVIIKGSQIQATTVNFMANFLNLISDKNSESYSSFSDGSGVLTRTIINQGYVKETAVAAQVNAQQITLNGKTLLEDKLKPENLLKQLSSEYNLNEAQISQVKAQLTNKEWYDKTTTISKMGMIIVQAVVTVLTAGAGTGLVAAVETGIDATVDAMVNAAINSMVTQTLTQIATAAITGNKIELDVNTLLTNSLKAAALAGLTAQIDTNLGLNKDNLSFADKSTQQILHGFAQKAVYGGSLESILATSAGNVAFDYIGHSVYSNDSQFPQLRDAIPKTVIHSLVGGTLAELAGGDFSQGAINTAVSHTVAEYMDKELLDKTVKGDISKEEANAYIKAISSVVSGAAVLATHEKVSDKDLKIAQDMGNSVVENNALKGFNAKVEFGKGIVQGGGEKVWEDLKALGVAVTSPIETAKALLNLVTSPEALAVLGEDVVNDLKLKSINVYNAVLSDTEYEGEKANQAGKDLGELALTVLESYTGVKGVTTGVNAAKGVLEKVATNTKNAVNDIINPDITKLAGRIDPTTGKPMLDMSTLTNAQKGTMGELFGESVTKQIIPDGQKLSTIQTIGSKGIDDLYKVNRPDVDYVIVEYKFNTATQGMTNDGLQASQSWITGSDRLVKSVGKEAGSVRDSIEAGRTETWLINVMPDGSSNIKVLDQAGKPKNIDTSKIIIPNKSYNGAVQ